MRILTVRQPWAEAIIFGGKDVENRTRNVAGDYRGPVAIHTAKRAATPEEWLAFDTSFPEAMSRMTHSVPWAQEEFGHIIGVVDLVGVHTDLVGGRREAHCSPWAQDGTHHLVLRNPRALREPIPFKGALGLRKLDAETVARLEALTQTGERADG